MIARDGILGLGALHEVILLLFIEDDLHDGVLDVILHWEAVAVDVALEVLHGAVDVHGGGLGEVLGEEEVVARGKLVEHDTLHGVVHQGNVTGARGGLGHGLGIGALPGVDVHIDLDIGGHVGSHLELDPHEGGGDVRADTEGGVHVKHGLTRLALVGVLDAADVPRGLAIPEGLGGGVCKADLQLGLSSLLHAVDVQESLGVGGA